MQRKYLKLYFQSREEKRIQMEMKFLYSTRSGKTSIPEDDGDKLHMNIAIPRANTKKSIERNILKNTTNHPESQKYTQITHTEVKNQEQKNDKQRKQIKTSNKIADLYPNISIITLNVNTVQLRFSNISHLEQFGSQQSCS